jgi:hypothetical protein
MTGLSCADNPHLVDEPALAHILRGTLGAILVSALAFSALTLLLRWRLAPQLSLVVAVSSLVALALSRSGRRRQSIMLPLLTISYVVLHLAARSEGIQNIGHAIIPVLIVMCSLLLDGVTLAIFTAGEILAVAGMLAIRYFVLRVERFSLNDPAIRGFRHRAWNASGDPGQGVRPVLHHQVPGTRARTRGGP